jgi:chromosome partitioning protein
MGVITFASTKGGAGKTTSAIILGTTLAKHSSVFLIDADPACRLMSWANKGPLPLNLTVYKTKGEKWIHDEIDSAKQSADYVIIDLEGAASRLNAYAMGESDLVIVPMAEEHPDAEGAVETLAQVALESKAMRRKIITRILFANTQAAVKSRLAKSLNQQVRQQAKTFITELNRRTAFSSLHNFGGDLYHMDPLEVSGVLKAVANAELFAEEVVELLQAVKTGEAIKKEPRRRING